MRGATRVPRAWDREEYRLGEKNIFIPREEFKTTSRLTHARHYEMLYKNDSVIVKDDGE